MFLINLNTEIVACILSFRKSRHTPNLENTTKYGFSPDLGGKNGDVLSMRMQVILDSSFARPGSAPIWGGMKGEFRDWTKLEGNLLRCVRARAHFRANDAKILRSRDAQCNTPIWFPESSFPLTSG